MLERLFTRNVDLFGAPKLLTNSGPKKLAFTVEMLLIIAAFRVVFPVNDALEVWIVLYWIPLIL